MKFLALLSLLVGTCFLSAQAMAQDRNDDGQTLRVGIYGDEPFAMPLPNGSWHGAALDLWREVARTAGYRYRPRILGSYDEMVELLANGDIDVAVGDMEVSASVEEKVDFLLPYHQSHLGIATRTQSRGSLAAVFGRILSPTGLKLALLVILIVAGLTALIWRLEKKHNPDIFGESGKDFVSGAVWTAIIATAIEGDLFKMRSRGARVLGLIMVLVGVTVVASYIALVSSALTVQKLTPQVQGASQLKHVQVGVEAGQAGRDYAARNDLKTAEYASLDDMFDALEAGSVDAVIGNRTQMHYHLEHHGGTGLTVLEDTLTAEGIAFAVAQGSPLREPLNRALLNTIEDGTWDDIRQHYSVR